MAHCPKRKVSTGMICNRVYKWKRCCMSESDSKLSVSSMIEGECWECGKCTCYTWEVKKENQNMHTFIAHVFLNVSIVLECFNVTSQIVVSNKYGLTRKRFQTQNKLVLFYSSHNVNNPIQNQQCVTFQLPNRVCDTLPQATSFLLKTELFKNGSKIYSLICLKS